MALNLRIPFDDIVSSRDATLDKDAIITNAFCDQVTEGVAIVKRPGLINKTSALGLGISGALGLGQGIFFFNNKVYSWNSIDPGTTWYGFIQSNDKLLTAAATNLSSDGDRVLTIDTNENIVTKEMFDIASTTGYAALLYTGSRFIVGALSSYFASTPTVASIDYSSDGVTWTPVAIPAARDYTCGTIKGTTICLVEVGLNYTLVSTNNGSSWTQYNPAKNYPDGIYSVASNGTVFTTGDYYSTDGITWTHGTGAVGVYDNIIYNGTGFIAISAATGAIRISTDGIAWTSTTPTGTGASALFSTITKFAWSGSIYAGITQSGYAIYSTNGTTWTLGNRQYSPTIIPDQIKYFNGAFYALTHSPTSLSGAPFNISFIEKSTDGINWTRSIIDVALFNETPTIISGLV
jgi:hypothetical protein